jgi:hypothetical protein
MPHIAAEGVSGTVNGYSVAFAQHPGYTNSNYTEDRYGLHEISETCLLAMVCDGHSSTDVIADMIKRHMPSILRESLTDAILADPVAIERVLVESFQEMDETIRSRWQDPYGGSTCTVAIVTPTHVVFAWVGDSPAILTDMDGNVQYVTRDHDCFNPDEVARLGALNPPIVCEEDHNFTMRMGDMMMSRAFGDFHSEPGMISVPDTASVPRVGRQRLIIASDFITERLTTLPDGRQLIKNILKPAEVAAEITGYFTPGTSVGDAVMMAITDRVESFYYEAKGTYNGDNATLGIIELGEVGVVAVGGRGLGRSSKGRSSSSKGRSSSSKGRSSSSKGRRSSKGRQTKSQKKLKHRSRRHR